MAEMKALGNYTLALALEQSGDLESALEYYKINSSLTGQNSGRDELTERSRMAVVRIEDAIETQRHQEAEQLQYSVQSL